MNSSDAIWQAAETAVVAGDAATLERLLREHAAMFRDEQPKSSWLGGLAPDYSSADARAILAREHYFADFDELARYLDSLKDKESCVARFEAAVDAVHIDFPASIFDEPALDRPTRAVVRILDAPAHA